MSPRAPILAFALAAAALLLGSGCISKSSTSEASSESSSNSSASSSSSSTSSSGPSAYERDVRDYTREWLLSGGDRASFQRKLGEIASKRGVSDWEHDEATYKGIGRGLKKAGVKGQRLQGLEQELAGPDPKSMQWMRAGYDAEKAD